jgi:hypothetical protein
MSAKLVDGQTQQELLRSRNIQLKAILARFGGDVQQAARYCAETSLTSDVLRCIEYDTYMHEFVRAMAVGA